MTSDTAAPRLAAALAVHALAAGDARAAQSLTGPHQLVLDHRGRHIAHVPTCAAAGLTPQSLTALAAAEPGLHPSQTWDALARACALVDRRRTAVRDLLDLARAGIGPSQLTGQRRQIAALARLARALPPDLAEPPDLHSLTRLLDAARRTGLGVTGAAAWITAGLPWSAEPDRPCLRDWATPASLRGRAPRHAWASHAPSYAAAGYTPAQALGLISLPDGHPDKPAPERLAVMAALR